MLHMQLDEIYVQMIQKETIADNIASKVHNLYRLSAKNLYRYLILRNFELRNIHDNLSEMGISSLRTSEGYVTKKML